MLTIQDRTQKKEKRIAPVSGRESTYEHDSNNVQ